MKKKGSTMRTQTAKSGDVVVIYGRTTYDRQIIKYTDAKDLVAYLRERDYPEGDVTTNEEYMRLVLSRIKAAYEDFNLPYHNEDAFVSALFRMGMFGKATLN